eukprot:TRINITY_DN5871_c0_g1_i1.p1 TRINITY_DN5871_c0_g1~~TRINITY_DN5871_c0_g1_i1.p1  ORF type:complete len:609 (+),score=92.36 TRINITY_DN5871_c0_g1_i1:102-1928(+)
MQIFIQADKTYTVEIDAQASVEELMQRVQAKMDLPSADLVISTGLKLLQPGRTVREYGIQAMSTLRFVRGRPDPAPGKEVQLFQRARSSILTRYCWLRHRSECDTVEALAARMLDANPDLGGLADAAAWRLFTVGNTDKQLVGEVTDATLHSAFRGTAGLAFIYALGTHAARECYADFTMRTSSSLLTQAESHARLVLQKDFLRTLTRSVGALLLYQAGTLAERLEREHGSLLAAWQLAGRALAGRTAGSPCVASLEAVVSLPQRLKETVTDISEWLQCRAEASRQRALLHQAQCAPGLSTQCGAVRRQALAAQRRLVDMQGSREVLDLIAAHQLLLQSQADCRKHGAAPEPHPEPVSTLLGALHNAAAAASSALAAIVECGHKASVPTAWTEAARKEFLELTDADAPALPSRAVALTRAAEDEIGASAQSLECIAIRLAAAAAAADAVTTVIKANGNYVDVLDPGVIPSRPAIPEPHSYPAWPPPPPCMAAHYGYPAAGCGYPGYPYPGWWQPPDPGMMMPAAQWTNSCASQMPYTTQPCGDWAPFDQCAPYQTPPQDNRPGGSLSTGGTAYCHNPYSVTSPVVPCSLRSPGATPETASRSGSSEHQ